MPQFLKVKNRFINTADIKSFDVECAKEDVGGYEYPDGKYISDLFLILNYYDGTSEEIHYYTHYKTESRYDEMNDFEATVVELAGEKQFESLMTCMRNTNTYRNGNDYVREEDKIEFGNYGEII